MLAGLAVAGGAAMAVAIGAGPAVGQISPPIQTQLQVNSPATLLAKGSSVNVSVTASCSGTTAQAGIFLEITENVSKHIAFGFTESVINCTGTSQTFDLLVIAGSESPSGLPQGPSKAFAKGVALATASIEACSPDGITCTNQQIEPTITIRK
ncbi:MAG: hypothetical protein WBH47_27640 [Streptosporangiaceae bacterium]